MILQLLKIRDFIREGGLEWEKTKANFRKPDFFSQLFPRWISNFSQRWAQVCRLRGNCKPSWFRLTHPRQILKNWTVFISSLKNQTWTLFVEERVIHHIVLFHGIAQYGVLVCSKHGKWCSLRRTSPSDKLSTFHFKVHKTKRKFRPHEKFPLQKSSFGAKCLPKSRYPLRVNSHEGDVVLCVD